MNKLFLLIRFFLTSNQSNFRKSILFPYTCIVIGVFVATLTTVVTNGIKNQVTLILDDFTYPIHITINNNIESVFISDVVNYGEERLVGLIKHGSDQIIPANSISYSNYNSFINRISPNYIELSDNNNNQYNIIISENFSSQYSINLNDKLKLYAISDTYFHNIFPSSIDVNVCGIYKEHFTDYQLIIPYNISKKMFVNNYYTDIYFENIDSKKEFIKANDYTEDEISYKNSNLILKWINIEMALYILISYVGILISGFVMYVNNVLSYLEKRKQLRTLKLFGLSYKKSIFLIIIKNLFISSFLCFLGLSLTYGFIILNLNFNIMLYLIPEPFDYIHLQFSFKDILITYFMLFIIMCISSIFPYVKYSNK